MRGSSARAVTWREAVADGQQVAHVPIQLLVPAAARRLVGHRPHEQGGVVVPLRILQCTRCCVTTEKGRSRAASTDFTCAAHLKRGVHARVLVQLDGGKLWQLAARGLRKHLQQTTACDQPQSRAHVSDPSANSAAHGHSAMCTWSMELPMTPSSGSRCVVVRCWPTGCGRHLNTGSPLSARFTCGARSRSRVGLDM